MNNIYQYIGRENSYAHFFEDIRQLRVVYEEIIFIENDQIIDKCSMTWKDMTNNLKYSIECIRNNKWQNKAQSLFTNAILT